MITVEDWAEVRRLHRAEGRPIKEVVRQTGRLGTPCQAARSLQRPPKYERRPRGSMVHAYEPAIRALLASWPRMPGPVIAQRINWPYFEGRLTVVWTRAGTDAPDRLPPVVVRRPRCHSGGRAFRAGAGGADVQARVWAPPGAP